MKAFFSLRTKKKKRTKTATRKKLQKREENAAMVG